MPVEVLWCPNTRGNGWSFPRNVEQHLLRECEGKRVLHPFGGRSRFGVRVDIDPITKPDVIGDAWLLPFRRNSFDIVILDPPYFHINSQMKGVLFRGAAWVAREQVIWFSTIWASSGQGMTCAKAYLVRVGDNCHVRCLQHFRIVNKIAPTTHFTRGPQIKYNRWLAQPQGLPLAEGETFT